jgi:outer membrane protein OmpA-like peptidoglycan-associated protein
MKKQILCVCMGCFLLCSCSSKPQEKEPLELFVLLPNPEDGSLGEILVRTDTGVNRLNRAGASVQVSPDGVSVPVDFAEEEIQTIFGEVLSALPQAAEKHLLFFTPAQTVLHQESQDFLPELLQKIQARDFCEILVIGHSDTMGEAEYNLQVSQKRAEWMRNKLMALGIPKEQIQVEARGDTDLLVATGDNVPEPKNRRVEIILR